ncbi:MAG TPA: IPT/TIG domain-containing protein, partial [Thermoanaerobaculia bacterium]|nr:IPT/TIG domain-containing protein [Thermoanaerobaculia bacterium]
MNKIRQRKFLFALLALVLVFAGCKGESPTAPPPSSGGGTPGGGVTPPTGSVITLTVSNATPLIDSTSVITATVTKDNQPVPNGTAVEFQASPLGTFTDSGTNTSLRTTTNGVTSVTVTSSTAGTTTITAVVTNVTKTTTIEFKAKPVTQPPVDTSPTITGISPNFGRPQGGQTVRITGTNFRTPLRVLFDFGAGTTPKEALPISSSATTIDVL